MYVSVSTTQRLAMTEHLASSPKERSTYCGSQFKGTVHRAGASWQQGLEAGGHAASSQEVMNASVPPLYGVQGPRLENDVVQF